MKKKKDAQARRDRAITAGATVALILLFSLLGRAMGPHWQPKDSDAKAYVETADTAIRANGSGALPIGTYGVDETTISIALDSGETISAIVRTPQEPADPDEAHPRLAEKIPGCMFITGAGLAKATDVYGDIGWNLASAGVATIVPDKPMHDYTYTRRDYVGMAHDYEKALDALQEWDRVDRDNVGLYAESEGTWITPIIAVERPEVSFNVMVSAPVYTPREQITYAMDDYFRVLRVPFPTNRVISRVTTLGMGSLGPNYADFDVAPYLERLEQPTLLCYGTNDLSMPTIEAPNYARQILSDHGNTNMLVRYYAGANHQMRVGDARAKKDLPLADGFMDDVAAYAQDARLSQETGWDTPYTAGDQPWQASAVVAGLSESGVGGGLIGNADRLAWVQGGGLALMLLALLSVPFLRHARTVQIRKEKASAQLTANSSPGSAETGNIILTHDLMKQMERRRHGFARGMVAPLWLCGGMTALATLVWLGFIAYLVVGVFSLDASRAVMIAWQTVAEVLVVAAIASLVHLVLRWVRCEQLHRSESDTNPAAVSGVGHIVWIVAYLLGVVLLMVMFMFWGVFVLW